MTEHEKTQRLHALNAMVATSAHSKDGGEVGTAANEQILRILKMPDDPASNAL